MPSIDDWAEAHVNPMGAVGLAIVAVSTSAILVRWSQAPSLVKAFYRILLMTLVLVPFAGRHVDTLRTLSTRDVGFTAAAGLALAAHFATWFESLEWTTVAASVTLVQVQPVFVALGAAFLLDERLTGRMVVGIAVALVGAVLMSVGGVVLAPAADALLSGGTAREAVARAGDALASSFAGSEKLYGDALALVGAITAAGYVLAGRSVRQRLPLVPYTLVVYGVCTVALLVVVLLAGRPLLGYPPREWALFAAMALVPGVFGHTVINWALKYVESSVVSVALLGEPVGSTLLALVLLSEVPDAATVAGGVIVLVGIFVTSRARAT